MSQSCTAIDLSAAVDLVIEDINYTRTQMIQDIRDALTFSRNFDQIATSSPDRGLTSICLPEWAPRLLKKKGIPGAMIEKIGSLTFVKRRPNDIAPFTAYAEKMAAIQKPLLFRIAFGPLKNINLCGLRQTPDLAEYLTLIQLARLMTALAPLYPYEIMVQIVPDDLRARKANLCPVNYTQSYIAGLKNLVRLLSWEDWIKVEDGEEKLYAAYRVDDFTVAAEEKLKLWQHNHPEVFAGKWHCALRNADKNLAVMSDGNRDHDVAAAAWRYLCAHQAEILSGMWSPVDAFPLIFANHPNAYQVYSLGYKKSKLPWQIALSLDLAEGSDVFAEISEIFESMPGRGVEYLIA